MLSSINSFPPYSVAVAAVAILLSFIYFYLKDRKLPPGPRGLPYLGLWPKLSFTSSHLQLQEYGRKYGDIFSYRYMGNLMINLGSVKAMREFHVQKSDCFEERFSRFSLFTCLMKNSAALVNGENWKVLRKHFLQSIKEYGMASLKEDFDTPIYESLTQTIEEIRKTKGQPINVLDLLVRRCSGSMRKIMFGIDGVTDEELTLINDNFNLALNGTSGTRMLYIGPIARLIYTFVPLYRKSIVHLRITLEEIRKVCKRVESNFDGEHPRNIIESFYNEKQTRLSKKDPTAKYFRENCLVETLAQFVGDGIVSVAYFIRAFLCELVRHPDEQEKLFEEIKEVIGLHRLPTIEDRGRMPYTNAFMNEVMRTCNFLTLFASLECTKETTIRGFTIPKGAITAYNLYSVHNDTDTFQNPEKFDPERYISKPGKHRAELPALFGIGKRACSGEALVMMETFLFLTTIVKEFKLSVTNKPEEKSSMFMTEADTEICFQPRSEM